MHLSQYVFQYMCEWLYHFCQMLSQFMIGTIDPIKCRSMRRSTFSVFGRPYNLRVFGPIGLLTFIRVPFINPLISSYFELSSSCSIRVQNYERPLMIAFVCYYNAYGWESKHLIICPFGWWLTLWFALEE